MRRFKVSVDGREYEVVVEEYGEKDTGIKKAEEPTPAAAPTPKAAPRPAVKAPENAKEIKAPLGGTILKVNVKEGDRVNSGQILMTLEAMKLENEIVAPIAGIIRGLNVSPGTTVEVGQTLTFIEPA